MAGTAAQPGRVLRSSPAFEQMGIDGSWRCRSASGSLSLGLGELAAEKHVRYIVTVEKKDSFESLVMEHIRVNGAYWGLTTLDLLHKLHAVEADEFIGWIMSCYHPDSGSARRGGGGID
ncbi:geranylgeranyl transferase type-2 subunit beta 1-like [Oryza glaberrima]|uniref:geranylgeranyl transferase type-2 subunit beta 1-like n=1 Tax=Oryza glaberrima TaxID=4538 RepID=UPI00224C536C|nr:geranylgeranyl transferase type-2 subunit beta 1-like [Oryza glaberrima]